MKNIKENNNLINKIEQNDLAIIKRKKMISIISFIVTALLLLVLFFVATNTGSLKVGFMQLWSGIFIEYDRSVSIIWDLRFPRIIIAMLAGSAIAVSGVLFQAVLKNPLADPGILGISSGASFSAALVIAFAPQLIFITPIFAFLGGVFAFLLVYLLSLKDGLNPLRIILTGVAINILFTGFLSAFNSMYGADKDGIMAIVTGNINQKTWDDVYTLIPYVVSGLILAVIFIKECNLLSLEDKTARGLGINVNSTRFIISSIAVLLASIATAIVGIISFLGLIVPHIARILVGSDHKKLIPFSALFGALTFLFADTVGRTIAHPYEISAAIIMSVIGGPFFIILLRRSKRYGK